MLVASWMLSHVWLPCMFHQHSQSPFSQCPRKNSIWSLGGSKPTHSVPPTPCSRKSLQLSQLLSAMLSFSSRLGNWKADKGLLGTLCVYSHWVQDSRLELLPLVCPLKIKEVWSGGWGKKGAFLDSAQKSWERQAWLWPSLWGPAPLTLLKLLPKW